MRDEDGSINLFTGPVWEGAEAEELLDAFAYAVLLAIDENLPEGDYLRTLLEAWKIFYPNGIVLKIFEEYVYGGFTMFVSEDNITYWDIHCPQAVDYDYWEWPETLVLRGTIVHDIPHDLTHEVWQNGPFRGLFPMPWWHRRLCPWIE